MKFQWVIDNHLARYQRPGYSGEDSRHVSQFSVDSWMGDVRASGIKSIICLLAEDQLVYYSSLPAGLIAYYERGGFSVAHIPAVDHQRPPLTPAHLAAIWKAYGELPKPVLIHCSAGIDRTGRAVDHILGMLRTAERTKTEE